VFGEPVEVWRLVQVRAVTAEVAPAEIVGEDEDDVGFRFGGVQRGQRCEHEGGNQKESHRESLASEFRVWR